MDGKSGLQLLPGTKKRLGLKVPGENRFLYVGSAVLGAVLVTIFALGRYETDLQGQLDQVNDQITSLEQTRNKSEEAGLKLLQQRLQGIEKLIDNHIYWTKALTVIAGLTQNDVRFKSFSGDTNLGSINIKIQAASYAALARQAASFLTEPTISDLSLGKISVTADGVVETDVVIEFNPVFLSK